MHFHERSPLPAGPAEVFAVMTDESFLAARAQHTGSVGHSGDVQVVAGQTVVTTSRTVSTDRLPSVASKFLGGTAVVEQVERWDAAEADGSRNGTFQLTVKGAPVELTARTRLSPEGTGSVHDIEGDLTVRVPLIGRSVEQAALPGLLDLVRAEVGLARERLRQ